MGMTFASDLYYGRIAPWEQRRARCMSREALNLNRKLEQEREYLTKKMSKEDRRHFENYDRLNRECSEQEQIESFRQGLRIGALFMETILCDHDTLTQW